MSASEPPPGQFRFATGAMPPGLSDGDKMQSWMDAMSGIAPLDLAPLAGENRPYWANMKAQFAGGIMTAEIATSGCVVRRTAQGISKRTTDTVYVFQQINPKGSSFTTWKGRRGGQMEAGDIFIGATDEPFESVSGEDFGHRLWLIPSRLVMPFAQAPSELEAGVWMRANDPCNRMIASYLGEFAQQGPRMSPEMADVFAGNIGRLLSIASVPQDDALRRAESARMARLARIKQEIEKRLADPLISPGRIADVLGMSLRTLHASFSPTEESCAAYITRRRLEEAHALVTRAPARSISDIAFGLGFNSMGTFFRVYRAQYGETPSDTRRLSLT